MIITYPQLLKRLSHLDAGENLPTIVVKFDRRSDFISVTNQLATLYTFDHPEYALTLEHMYLRIGKRSSSRLIGIRSPSDHNAGSIPYPLYKHYRYSPTTIIHQRYIT